MASGSTTLRDDMRTETRQRPIAPPDSQRWWTLAVLCLSLLMVVVGNTALNVAIPTLVRDIGATDTQLQWIVDAYSLVFAGLLLTCGALGDRFGRKGALNIGLAIFATGSFLAGISDTPNQLIVCRAIIGAGGALIMPATLSILTNVFPVHERARAIAIWARSEEHTSELQSRRDLVCRLLLEKKKKINLISGPRAYNRHTRFSPFSQYS